MGLGLLDAGGEVRLQLLQALAVGTTAQLNGVEAAAATPAATLECHTYLPRPQGELISRKSKPSQVEDSERDLHALH